MHMLLLLLLRTRTRRRRDEGLLEEGRNEGREGRKEEGDVLGVWL
jgi:hypothetical protein